MNPRSDQLAIPNQLRSISEEAIAELHDIRLEHVPPQTRSLSTGAMDNSALLALALTGYDDVEMYSRSASPNSSMATTRSSTPTTPTPNRSPSPQTIEVAASLNSLAARLGHPNQTRILQAQLDTLNALDFPGKLRIVNAENKKLENQVEELIEIISRLTHEKSILLAASEYNGNEYRNTMEQYREQLATVNDKYAQTKAHLAQLQQMTNDLLAENEHLKGQYQTNQESSTKLLKENMALKKQLESSTATNSTPTVATSSADELETLQQHYKDLSDAYLEIVQKNKKLLADNQKLQQANDKLEKKRSERHERKRRAKQANNSANINNTASSSSQNEDTDIQSDAQLIGLMGITGRRTPAPVTSIVEITDSQNDQQRMTQ